MYHQRHRLLSSGWIPNQRVTGHISTVSLGDDNYGAMLGAGEVENLLLTTTEILLSY